MINPLLLILFFADSFLIGWVGAFLFKWQPKPLLLHIKFGAILSLFTYLVRSLFINFLKLPIPSSGLVLILVSIVLMKIIFKKKICASVGATLIAYIVLIASESVISPFFLNLLNWNIDFVQINVPQYLIIGFLSEIPLYIIAVIAVIRRRKTILNERIV